MMNKRLLYLLITLIGIFSVSMIGHFSGQDSQSSSPQHKVHPTYKTSLLTFSCIDESEVDTSDFDQSDDHDNQSYDLISSDFGIHHEDFRLLPIASQNSFGKSFNGIPKYLIFQNFRI